MPDLAELLAEYLPLLPTLQQVVFFPIAGFVAIAALLTVFANNLFHSALGLIATLFGVAVGLPAAPFKSVPFATVEYEYSFATIACHQVAYSIPGNCTANCEDQQCQVIWQVENRTESNANCQAK